jgi:Tol biopolymer transport system component
MKHFNPVSCEYWADKLMIRPDALSAEEQNGLHEHIRACADCREQYLVVHQLSHDLQSLFVSLQPPQRQARLAQLKTYHAAQEGRLNSVYDKTLSTRRSTAEVPPWHTRLFGNVNIHEFPLSQKKLLSYSVMFAVIVITCVVMTTLLQVILGAPGSVVQADSLSLQGHPYESSENPGWVHTVAWSSNGYNIALILSDNHMEVWNTHTKKEMIVLKTEVAWGAGLAWSPDGKFLATIGIDDNINVLDVERCQLHSLEDACLPVLVYTGHNEPVNAIAWSPDGTKIASASDDKTVQVWNSKTGKLLRKYTDSTYGASETPGKFTSIAWSPDSQDIVSGDDNGHVQIWKALSGKLVLNYTGHLGDPITSVSWSPKGDSIASAGYKGILRVWNASTGKTSIKIYSVSTENNRNDPIYSVAWSPDGKALAFVSYNILQVRDAITGTMFSSHLTDTPGDDGNNSFFTVAWSPDGQQIVCGGQGDVFDFKLGG